MHHGLFSPLEVVCVAELATRLLDKVPRNALGAAVLDNVELRQDAAHRWWWQMGRQKQGVWVVRKKAYSKEEEFSSPPSPTPSPTPASSFFPLLPPPSSVDVCY